MVPMVGLIIDTISSNRTQDFQKTSIRRWIGNGLGSYWILKKLNLIFVDHTMNAEYYQEMVEPLFPVYGSELAWLRWIFQQDNTPIHRARLTLNYFRERDINLLEPWPSKLPDLNIIENTWSLLAIKVYKDGRQYESKKELKAAIIEAWEIIDQATIQNLYHSLQRRMIAFYNVKGKWTKY